MSIPIATGYRFAGVHCGVKRNPNKHDLALVVSDRPATAAGVYTQNRVFAAPVALNRGRTPRADARLVVVNSGNANACTGEQGLADAAEMARLAADACGAAAEQALVLSTGVIGVFLPMDKIRAGIESAAARLAVGDEALAAAARGMMTTDTVHKLSGREVPTAAGRFRVTGMAKGAAMIGPNMATMLAVVLTDAPLDPAAAQDILSAAVNESFNCISVEGHMSTNDTVLLLANGAAAAEDGGPARGAGKVSSGNASAGRSLSGEPLVAVRRAIEEVCGELARAIVADGEGATHLVTIDVAGCRTRQDAHRIAKTVAESALVKTAISGADPNWGRIVSAVGYAGVPFDPAALELELNGHLLFRQGAPVAFVAADVSRSIRDNRDTHILLRLAEGDAGVRFWTTDLTAEYVRLNADYTT